MTRWPRSSWMRTTAEKNRFASIARTTSRKDSAKPARPTPRSDGGRRVVQPKRLSSDADDDVSERDEPDRSAATSRSAPFGRV